MEDLIRQAFLHVEVIGPHVAEGHYDLVGPNGEIILPQVWETMIEPDWVITMHMWPMPEPPPEPPPPDPNTVVDVPPKEEAVPPPPPPPPAGMLLVKCDWAPLKSSTDFSLGTKKKPPAKSSFLSWTAGKPKNSKSLKSRRKPEGTGSLAQPPEVVS